MNIKRKFYLYLLATIGLAFPLVESIHLTYSSGESIFVIFLITIIAFYYYLYIRIRKDFLAPFSDLQRWVKDYKQNQNARLKDRDDSSFNSVAQAINHLIDENQNLYDDMETILRKQIDRLSKKTASLETLYEVSSKINKLKSIDEIYKHFLDIFIKMTGASSGAVRIFNKLNQLELQTSFGSKNKAGLEKVIDPHQCFCGEIANSTSAQVQFSVKRCARCIGTKASDKATVGTIVVPLSYREVNLGIFLLFFDSEPSLPYDERALIQSMADNIAIAIDKARVDDESKRMSLTQQRLLLSQEIHDSLAQTIYSLKLQTTVVEDLLKNSEYDDALWKVSDIHENLTQANKELRQLMSNYRIPLDPEGLIPSLQKLAERFQSIEGVSTFFFSEGEISFSPEEELQILRIVQEGLTNIRKHAQAKNVRIMIKQEPSPQLIIEDDGVGFKKQKNNNKEFGNNIGLKIMRERASAIDAKFDIDSDLGEGTIITLQFNK